MVGTQSAVHCLLLTVDVQVTPNYQSAFCDECAQDLTLT